jgi:hypothetical protein
MFLEHLNRQILKRRYAQGWGIARSKSSMAYFEKKYRGFALIWLKIVPTVCGTTGWTRPKQTPL